MSDASLATIDEQRANLIALAIVGDANSDDLRTVLASGAGAEIAGKIMMASTAEEADALADAEFEATATQDLEGQVITIRPPIRWLPTTFDRDPGTPQLYATFEAVDEDGAIFNVRTSSATLLAQLFAYERTNSLPIARRIKQSEEKSAGGTYWLRFVEP